MLGSGLHYQDCLQGHSPEELPFKTGWWHQECMMVAEAGSCSNTAAGESVFQHGGCMAMANFESDAAQRLSANAVGPLPETI